MDADGTPDAPANAWPCASSTRVPAVPRPPYKVQHDGTVTRSTFAGSQVCMRPALDE